MESGLLLDVVVSQGAAILELLAREDQTLLVRRDAWQSTRSLCSRILVMLEAYVIISQAAVHTTVQNAREGFGDGAEEGATHPPCPGSWP